MSIASSLYKGLTSSGHAPGDCEIRREGVSVVDVLEQGPGLAPGSKDEGPGEVMKQIEAEGVQAGSVAVHPETGPGDGNGSVVLLAGRVVLIVGEVDNDGQVERRGRNEADGAAPGTSKPKEAGYEVTALKAYSRACVSLTQPPGRWAPQPGTVLWRTPPCASRAPHAPRAGYSAPDWRRRPTPPCSSIASLRSGGT